MSSQAALSLRLLTLCFFGSGLTGLVYELVWTRRLQLTFGSTTYSVTTVLAAFMAGLGLGSYIVGRIVDRYPERGVRIYAYLELGVAAYALISLPLLGGVEWLYGVMQRWLELGQAGAALLKLALAFPVLALPAGMMGGTLPALVRATVRRRTALHHAVGRLYGFNTIGAAIGTLLTGTLLIEWLGLSRTVLVSALVNASIGGFVLYRLRAAERAAADDETARRRAASQGESVDDVDDEAAADDPPPAPEAIVGLRYHLRRPEIAFCAVAVVLTGVLSMSYEIVWTRLLGLVMGSSTYAFTIVLGIFLTGIAGGSLLYARLAGKREPTALGLAQLLFGLALWVALTLAFIPTLPRLLMQLAQLPGLDFSRVLLFEIAFAIGLLLVPTLILGAALPMAMGIVSRALGQVGRDVGGVYLANTLGAIAGSVFTGFVLVPWLGSQRTLVVGLAANLLLVGLAFVAFARRPLRRAIGGALALLVGMMAFAQPPWPAIVFDSGLGYRLDVVRANSRAEMHKRLRRLPNKLLFRSEGVNATISVRHFENGVSLLVNGKPDASTSSDMATQTVLGIIATAVHPRPRDVNIVGWGSGVTAHTVTLFPEVRRLDVIEIERGVLDASRFFHSVNGAAEKNKRVHIYFDDARSFYLTNERRYDVIISEPSNPWMAGVSGLFSRDFYALAKRRLKRDGIFGQWLQLYRIDARSVALVLRTVRRAFKHVELWFSDAYNVMMLASDSPMRASYARVAALYKRAPKLPLLMEAFGPGADPAHFFGCFIAGGREIDAITKRFPDEQLSDDRPVLEYRAVRNIYRPTPKHMSALVSLKIARAALYPPSLRERGSARPPADAVLFGAATALRTLPAVARRLVRWGSKRFGVGPSLALANARQLLKRRRYDLVLKLARALPSSHPGWQGERWLLEGRVALARARPKAALAAFDKIGAHRPVARYLFTLRAALAAADYERGFAAAEALIAAAAKPTPDGLRLERHRLYDRELRQLIHRSGKLERGLALLARTRPRPDGEVRRLVLLLETQHRARRYKRAAKTLDALRAFRLFDPRLAPICKTVYRAVSRPEAAKRCRAELAPFFPAAPSAPLWKAK